MSFPLPIETDRLLIRPFVPDADCEQMLGIYDDREVMHFIPGGALAGVAAVRSNLERYANTQRRLGFSSWAVVARESELLIGDVGFGIFEPTGDIELGYTLGRQYWGRGYATEAARACLTTALAHLAPPRIIAVVDEQNDASRRVAQRIGMAQLETLEAHGRPHALFATGSDLG